MLLGMLCFLFTSVRLGRVSGMMLGIISKMARGTGGGQIFRPAIGFDMIAVRHGQGVFMSVEWFPGPAALFAAHFTLPVGFNFDSQGDCFPVAWVFAPVYRHG